MKSNNRASCLFNCKKCNYSTNRKNDFEKHKLTDKHLRLVNNECKETSNVYACSICKKEYKHLRSLYRHERNCKEKNIILLEQQLSQLKDTDYLHDKIVELENKQNIVNNNVTVNNEFNINLFLNSNYNSAMNLDELKSQINLSIEDLLYTKNNGFIKGITNIFIKTLKELGPSKRPIHSDLKKPAFYIRNDNNWVEDKEHDKINAAIDDVAQAQINHLQNLQKSNSKWNETEAGANEYLEIVQNVLPIQNIEELNKSKGIIKEGLKETTEIEIK